MAFSIYNKGEINYMVNRSVNVELSNIWTQKENKVNPHTHLILILELTTGVITCRQGGWFADARQLVPVDQLNGESAVHVHQFVSGDQLSEESAVHIHQFVPGDQLSEESAVHIHQFVPGDQLSEESAVHIHQFVPGDQLSGESAMYIRQFVPVDQLSGAPVWACAPVCTWSPSEWRAKLCTSFILYLDSNWVERWIDHAQQYVPGVQLSGAPVWACAPVCTWSPGEWCTSLSTLSKNSREKNYATGTFAV